jgi:DNA topoisomerase-1
VFKKGTALVPTWVAFSVVKLLEDHLPTLVDYQFTAQMEDDLDTISRGEKGPTEYLSRFYFGNGQVGLKPQLKNKVEEIDARGISRIFIGKPDDGEEIYVRVGRYAPFIEQGERRAPLPEDTPPDEVNVETALKLLEQASLSNEPLGICPDTHKPVYLKVGRFGPYVQRGTPDDDEKPQNASLLKGMSPEDIDLKTALKLLSLPRNLGDHPETGQPVMAHNGRFGPYVKSGDETRSLPAETSPLEVSLDEALKLLAQPKTQGRRRGGTPQAIKEFEKSPVTGEPIKLLSGRYGPYVTDGTTNASLPKDRAPEELAFKEALDLLAARAELGPSKKKAARKKKSSAKKKTTAKKTASTKAAKKSGTSSKKAAKKKTSQGSTSRKS